jgi:hypothetical protein
MSNTTSDSATIAPAFLAGSEPNGPEPALERGNPVLPLILGGTGHRDLRAEDVRQFEARVREIFEEVQHKAPRTPLVVVSTLAEGADRLVARIALERGHRLVAPLPMAPEAYEEDFISPESKAEFRDLIARADQWFVVSDGRISIPPEDRSRGYALVGAYLAQSCQILIALWDGIGTGKPGGTSAVISFVRDGVPASFDGLLNGVATASPIGSLDEPEGCGLIYHVPTPRVSNPNPPCGPPVVLKKLYPRSVLGDEEIAKRFDRILASLDEFNADATTLGPRLTAGAQHRAGCLLTADQEAALPADLQQICNRFVLVDSLSLYVQDRTKYARSALVVLVFLAVLVFGLYAHVTPLQMPLLVYLYVAVFASAYFFWFLFAGGGGNASSSPWTRWLLSHVLPARLQWNYHRNYLDYRAVAEGLRVQFYWKRAGLGDRVEDHYFRQHRTELDWIRVALCIARLLRDDFRVQLPRSVPSGCIADLRQVLEHWLHGQQAFFTRAAKRDEKRLTRTEYTIHLLLCLGIVLALALVIPNHTPGDLTHEVLLLAAILAPAAAGVVRYQAERRALSEQKRRYERMSVLYRIAGDRLSELLRRGDLDGVRRIVRDLGLECLFENADWVLRHRDRPLAVPPMA